MITLKLNDLERDFLKFKEKATKGDFDKVANLIREKTSQNEYISTYCRILSNLNISCEFMIPVYKALENTEHYKKNVYIGHSPFTITPVGEVTAIHKLFAKYYLYKTDIEIKKLRHYSTTKTGKERAELCITQIKSCQKKQEHLKELINEWNKIDPIQLSEKIKTLIDSYNNVGSKQTIETLDKLKALHVAVRSCLLQVEDGNLLKVDTAISQRIRQISNLVQSQDKETINSNILM